MQILQRHSRCGDDLGGVQSAGVGATLAISGGMTPDELRTRLPAFAVQVDAFAAPLLASAATRNSADQLIRASSAAASNHRAAGRARSHAEFTAKIGTALEEADEAMAWVEHLVACKRVAPEVAAPIIAEAAQLIRILGKSCSTARRNEADRTGHERSRRPRHDR